MRRYKLESCYSSKVPLRKFFAPLKTQKLLYEQNIIKDKSEEKEPQREIEKGFSNNFGFSTFKTLQNPNLFQKEGGSRLFFFFLDKIGHDVLFQSGQTVFLFA